jgi:hypothetical protein
VSLSGRRLWALTAAVCAAIVVAGTPGLRAAVWSAEGALWAGIVLFALATTAVVVTLAGRLLARRDHPTAAVRRLSARGGSVADIARATDLAQDAVRDLLAAEEEAAAASVGRTGSFFRRPGASARRSTGDDRVAPRATASRG